MLPSLYNDKTVHFWTWIWCDNNKKTCFSCHAYNYLLTGHPVYVSAPKKCDQILYVYILVHTSKYIYKSSHVKLITCQIVPFIKYSNIYPRNLKMSYFAISN